MTSKPVMVMVCGSNGAGKSTFTKAAQEKGEYEMPFLDPDEIGKNAQASAVQAGKLVIAATKGYITDKKSFIRESTLSGKFDLKIIQEAKAKGFETELVYVCNGAPNTAVARVAQRYAKGGHTVPEEDIRRRFTRSLGHLPEAIRLVDKAKIYDNSGDKYKEVATFEKGKLKTHEFTPDWFKKPFEELKQHALKTMSPKEAAVVKSAEELASKQISDPVVREKFIQDIKDYTATQMLKGEQMPEITIQQPKQREMEQDTKQPELPEAKKDD